MPSAWRGLAVQSCRLLGGLHWGSNSPAASLNIDQKLLCKWMQQCQEGDISSEGDRDETEKEMSLESLLIGKMFALSQKKRRHGQSLADLCLHSRY